MSGDDFLGVVNSGLGLGESNELGWNDTPLVHELVEAVLTIGAWLSENDWTSVQALSESGSLERHSLSIALHVELLNMGRESQQSLAVWQNCS